MTINEHDRVSTGKHMKSSDGSASLTSAHALVDLLNAGEPYAVAFGGQGSNWLENLEELISSAGIESELSELVGEAELLLEPVARELVVVRPIGFEPMQWVRALAADEPLPTAKQLIVTAISGPGIVLAQMAAIRAVDAPGARSGGHPAGRHGGPLPGHHRRRVVEGERRPRRRTARDVAADRRGRLVDLAQARHGRAR